MKPTLLVVDDEPLLRMDLAATAKDEGFNTIEASNAAEALRFLESRGDIRVMFTDIRMPGTMDGLALAHLVRDRWPPIAVVICSGNSPPPTDQMPENVVFISKPLSGPKVARLIYSLRQRILSGPPL